MPIELGEDSQEHRSEVVKAFEAQRPVDDIIKDIKGKVSLIQKKMHESQQEDEDDNIETRTRKELFADLEHRCRFEESCEREARVKEIYEKWDQKIDKLLKLTQKNLPKIKKGIRRRLKEKADEEDRLERLRKGLPSREEEEKRKREEEEKRLAEEQTKTEGNE